LEYQAFVGAAYPSQSNRASPERLVNWYVEKMESDGASSRAALYPTPGVSTLATHTAAASGRAHFYINGREFAVIGKDFVEIDIDGTITDYGDVAVDGNPATISSNGDGGGQLFITSGGNGYLFTLSTNTFTSISALADKATMGDMLDGRFLALDAATSTVYISDLLDGATWQTGVVLFQRSEMPDRWIGMRVFNRYIYLFGTETSSVYYNSGNFPVPFSLHPSGTLQAGTAAGFSPKVVGQSVMWLGSTDQGDGQVWRTAGFTPEVISTFPVANAINGYGLVSDAIGDSYDDLGHSFYVLTFPTADATWCFDAKTDLWHERETWISETSTAGAWRPLFHAFAFGKHRILDRSGPVVYTLSSDNGLDVGGRPIRRWRVSPILEHENERLFVASFEIDMETGLGTQTGQGSDPEVMLQISKDGGKTYGPERWVKAGKAGKYTRRVRWTRNGAARQRVFKVMMTDPVPWRVTNAYLMTPQAPESQRWAFRNQAAVQRGR